MPKKKLLPRTAKPIEAVFLGLDTAKAVSGAVLLVPNYVEVKKNVWEFDGTYERSMLGTVEGADQASRAEYVQTGIDEAEELKVPFVVVAEEWTPGGRRMTFDVIKALGTGWGRWEAEIFKVNAIVIRYIPDDWRTLAFTWRYPKGREAVKLFAQNHIKTLWGYEVSEDVAEAACIAIAGTHSGEVAEAILKASKKKARR
jgi:hypothetical protein